MKFYQKMMVACLMVVFTISTVYAGANQGVFFHNIRNRAMGGVGIMSATGASAFVYNPALLTRGSISISPLTFQTYWNGTLADFAGFIGDNSDSLADFTELTPEGQNLIWSDMNNIDNRWIRLGIPLRAAITVKNIGAAAYMTTDLAFRLDKGIYEPRLYARGVSDLVFTGGIGKSLDIVIPGLKAGVSVKVIQRTDTDELKLTFSDFAETIEELSDSLETAKTGFGIDIGGLFSLNDNLEVGCVISDFVGSIEDYDLGQNLKLGVRYKVMERLSVEANWVDMFNTNGDALFNKLHIGGEFDLPILDLRAGINQGYPSIGIGVNLAVIRLDLAYWTQEMGKTPGYDGEDFFALEIGLGF